MHFFYLIRDVSTCFRFDFSHKDPTGTVNLRKKLKTSDASDEVKHDISNCGNVKQHYLHLEKKGS